MVADGSKTLQSSSFRIRNACFRSIGGQEWWVSRPLATQQSKLLQKIGLKRQENSKHLGVFITTSIKGEGYGHCYWSRRVCFLPESSPSVPGTSSSQTDLISPDVRCKKCRTPLIITGLGESSACRSLCMPMGLEKNHSPPLYII